MSFDWLKYPNRVVFLDPGFVEGTIVDIVEAKQIDGPAPVLTINGADGIRHVVTCSPVRLMNELVRLRPQVGDKIRIHYHGEAKKAPPGMSPTKEFTVQVWPRDVKATPK